MNLSRRIWHVGTVMTLVVLLLSARLVYWQMARDPKLQPVAVRAPRGAFIAGRQGKPVDDVVELEELEEQVASSELPQPVVQRTADLLENVTRGRILDRNGRVLAYTIEEEDGTRTRFYSEPTLAPTLGFVVPPGIGVSGVEEAFNESLLGLDRLDSWWSQVVHRPIVGNDVYLTVDSHLQRVAAEALGNRSGAVVVLDPLTGELLALASSPSVDPNQVLDPAYMESVLACDDPSCAGAFVNRGTLGLYPPGSTWKTVTLVAALDSGQVTPETMFDFGQPRQGPDGIYYVYEVDGAQIIDPNHDESQLDLTRSFAVSANAAFARMGYEMDPGVFRDYAARMGFGRDDGGPPIEIGAAPAQLAYDADSIARDNVLRAATAFGQGELLTSPLSMALVVAGVTGSGSIVSPRLLQQIVDPAGNVRETGNTVSWISNVMRPETAQQAAAIMVNAVRNGSGVRAAVPGATVGGKTGTAEVGEGQLPHAWFIGFAHEDERTVVVAVVVEHGGGGADVAAPIFSRVANAALREMGQPVEEIVFPPQ